MSAELAGEIYTKINSERFPRCMNESTIISSSRRIDLKREPDFRITIKVVDELGIRQYELRMEGAIVIGEKATYGPGARCNEELSSQVFELIQDTLGY